MDPFQLIDLYCERTASGLLAEPVNTLTNLAFLYAAWALWRRHFPREIVGEVRAMAVLIGLIGIGSLLFHLTGTAWGSWLDVGFIALFIVVFLHRYLRRLAQWPQLACWAGVLLYLVANANVDVIGDLGMNGSEGYLVPAALLLAMTIAARRVAPSAVGWLLMACVVFAVSLALRTLDMILCPQWPLGTHFAWHLLNAAVLYACVRGFAAGCRDHSGYF